MKGRQNHLRQLAGGNAQVASHGARGRGTPGAVLVSEWRPGSDGPRPEVSFYGGRRAKADLTSRRVGPSGARALDDLTALGEITELVHDVEDPLFVTGDLPCPEPEDLAVVEQDNAVFDGDVGGFGGQLRAVPCLQDQVFGEPVA